MILVYCIFILRFAFSLSVFPGAQGFGSETVGGSGRHLSTPNTTIFKVTNLESSGPGSLYDCVVKSYPRVCIFEVSGEIDISEGDTFGPRNPYITIAGETAPDPGITLKGGVLHAAANDVLISHLYVRTGDDPEGISPDSRDSVVVGKVSERLYNIVFDHISASFSIDELVSTTSQPYSITYSNCLFSHALYDSIHSKGPHSMGVLITDGTDELTMYNTIIAHNNFRNPKYAGCNRCEFVNNLVYNWGAYSTVIQCQSCTYSVDYPVYTHVIGNYYKTGINTSDDHPFVMSDLKDDDRVLLINNRVPEPYESDWQSVYFENDGASEEKNRADDYLFDPTVRSFSSEESYNYVLLNAGARPKNRVDQEDVNVINEIETGTGSIINCVYDDGSSRCALNSGLDEEYVIPQNSRSLDVPARYWEVEENGYTRLENWLFEFRKLVEPEVECFGVGESSTGTVCSGHGDCVGRDSCACDEGWDGDECQISEEGGGYLWSLSLMFIVFLFLL